jgi:hypothetical protein
MNDQLPDLTLRNGRIVTPSGVIRRSWTGTCGMLTNAAQDHILEKEKQKDEN